MPTFVIAFAVETEQISIVPAPLLEKVFACLRALSLSVHLHNDDSRTFVYMFATIYACLVRNMSFLFTVGSTFAQ